MTEDRLDALTFVTLDDMLRHLEAMAEASRIASDRLERLTKVLIVLTAVIVVLTGVLVLDAAGLTKH